MILLAYKLSRRLRLKSYGVRGMISFLKEQFWCSYNILQFKLERTCSLPITNTLQSEHLCYIKYIRFGHSVQSKRSIRDIDTYL